MLEPVSIFLITVFEVKADREKTLNIAQVMQHSLCDFPFMIADQTSGEIALTSERDRSHEILFEIDAKKHAL